MTVARGKQSVVCPHEDLTLNYSQGSFVGRLPRARDKTDIGSGGSSG